jgi:hypothetical protein
MAGEPGNNQTDDNSCNADRGGANVKIVLSEDSVKPFLQFVTLWVVLLALVGACAMTALYIANQAKTESRLSQYEYEQLREFMSQKGYPLPPDPSKPAGQK